MDFPGKGPSTSNKTHWLVKTVDISGTMLPTIRREVGAMMADHRMRHQSQTRHESALSVSNQLIKREAIKASGLGGITAASALLPGWGTLSALVAGTAVDLAYLTKIQIKLCYGISAAYDVDMDDEELKAVAVALLGFSGTALAAKHIAATTLKNIIDHTSALYLRTGLSKAAVELAEKLSPRLLSRSLKIIPFLGIPLNASINGALTLSVGKQAQKYFSAWAYEEDGAPRLSSSPTEEVKAPSWPSRLW